jgi:hypothetical protein
MKQTRDKRPTSLGELVAVVNGLRSHGSQGAEALADHFANISIPIGTILSSEAHQGLAGAVFDWQAASD